MVNTGLPCLYRGQKQPVFTVFLTPSLAACRVCEVPVFLEKPKTGRICCVWRPPLPCFTSRASGPYTAAKPPSCSGTRGRPGTIMDKGELSQHCETTTGREQDWTPGRGGKHTEGDDEGEAPAINTRRRDNNRAARARGPNRTESQAAQQRPTDRHHTQTTLGGGANGRTAPSPQGPDETRLLRGCNLRFPFFSPLHCLFLHLIQFTPPKMCPYMQTPMGPIVADGSLLVTGRGSRPRGLISNNKEVIFMFIIVILSTHFSRREALREALLWMSSAVLPEPLQSLSAS
mmetsp:Transcript_3203/g.9833  ORF Transcript_3203/g.9833 Transcript_3203/m.9833 type:complete len:288 (-) Transcript_3203:590-1453(-)